MEQIKTKSKKKKKKRKNGRKLKRSTFLIIIRTKYGIKLKRREAILLNSDQHRAYWEPKEKAKLCLCQNLLRNYSRKRAFRVLKFQKKVLHQCQTNYNGLNFTSC